MALRTVTRETPSEAREVAFGRQARRSARSRPIGDGGADQRLQAEIERTAFFVGEVVGREEEIAHADTPAGSSVAARTSAPSSASPAGGATWAAIRARAARHRAARGRQAG